MDGHFQSKELLRLLAEDLTSRERQRALDHFGRGCPDCWWNLTELARSWQAGPVEFEDRAAAKRFGSPVAQALERCLSFLAPRGEGAPPRCGALRPIHLHVLEQTCSEKEVDKRGLAFRRLVLEECRHRVLKEPAQLIERLRWTLEELPDASLGQREPHKMQALEALGWIYLADDSRITGLFIEADEFLARARRILDAGHGDTEIYATYFEIKADLARTRGNVAGALDLLRSAHELLKSCEIPGRRAETLLRLGLIRMCVGDSAAAAEEFRAALAELPPPFHGRLRLDALHYLAAAEVYRGRYDAAREALDQAELHGGALLSDLLRARRAWLWGVVYLDAREAGAEGMLRKAVDLFRKIGLRSDAAQALVDLGRHYARDQRQGDLRQVTLELVELLDPPEARLSPAKRRRIVDQATEIGIDRHLLEPDKAKEEEVVN